MKELKIRTGIALLLATAATVGSARATVIFNPGNHPQPGDENILLTGGVSGSTALGSGNNSGLPVSFFSSTDNLSEPSGGQARIEATSGLLNDILISIPGGSFESLIFNAFKGSGTAVVTAIANEPGGGTTTQTFDLQLGSGQNFATLTTAGGETLSSVLVSSAEGFADIRQIRIGGAAQPTVPDAGSTITLLAGSVGVLAAAQRKRQAR